MHETKYGNNIHFCDRYDRSSILYFSKMQKDVDIREYINSKLHIYIRTRTPHIIKLIFFLSNSIKLILLVGSKYIESFKTPALHQYS